MLRSNCRLLFQHLTSEIHYCFITKFGTKFSVNMTNIKSNKPYPILNIPSALTLSYDLYLNILSESALIALQWEAMLVHALLNSYHTVRKILPTIKAETFPQLKRPEEVIRGQCWNRIDVENVENVKTVEQAEQRKGKKKKKSDRFKEKKQDEQGEKAKREKEEQEYLRRWEECWQRKLEAQEERDRAKCCVEKGLCLKPKTQSNIWINVTQDRSIQEIQMHFKHVPVPKPKPPPPPPLRKQRPPEKTNDVSVQKSAQKSAQNVDKKSGTGKKKRK